MSVKNLEIMKFYYVEYQVNNMSHDIKEKMCKGCRSYNANHEPCCSISSIPYIPEDRMCPCSTCLIKVICYKPCHDFTVYSGKFIEIIRGKWNEKNTV